MLPLEPKGPVLFVRVQHAWNSVHLATEVANAARCALGWRAEPRGRLPWREGGGAGRAGRESVAPCAEIMCLESQRKEIKTKQTHSLGVPTTLRCDESEKKI